MDITKNYFQILSLPQQYVVDLSLLKQRIKSLQQQYHPDNVATLSDVEKNQAIQISSLLNQAGQCLQHPVKRAEYLLSLQGYSREDSQTIKNDPEFLMQQIEWREELEQVSQSQNEDALYSLQENIDGVYQQYQKSMDKLLGGKQYNAAMDLLAKMQFVDKLLQEISNAEDALLD